MNEIIIQFPVNLGDKRGLEKLRNSPKSHRRELSES